MIFMTFTTKPMEHQQKAIDKLSKTKVGALYMDMGTGKTRTALGLAVPRLLEARWTVFYGYALYPSSKL